MLLSVRCEYCGNEELKETGVIGVYYCDNCDEEIDLGELDIDVVNSH